MTGPKPDTPPSPSRAEIRRERQADALRENLRRRKQQQRGRAGPNERNPSESTEKRD